MEKLLHYIWNYRLFPLKPLLTTDQKEVEVIDTGLINRNAGPDFFNAKIKIGGILWVGNIEIHQHSSDWYRHGHHEDQHYNNVILHIAETIDTPILTSDHKTVPQLELKVPDHIRHNYEELCRTIDYPRCHSIIPKLDTFTVHSWMNALLYERLEQWAKQVCQRVEELNGDWETAYFITLSRNFGFGINGDAFEQWAKKIPLTATAKHRDSLFQIEAIFMGQAGLLDLNLIPQKYRQEAELDGYFNQLKKEYTYLAHKFSLTPMDPSLWKFMRLRPQNFPHVRLSQLAQLYYNQNAGLSVLLEAETTADLHQILSTQTTSYWESHYSFGCPSCKRTKKLTPNSLNLIIINTVVPTLYAYGKAHQNEVYCERAQQFLDPLKAEDNFITRQWEACGIKVKSACDSQALIQLKKEYCDRKYCLHCRFGYEFMKRKSIE